MTIVSKFLIGIAGAGVAAIAMPASAQYYPAPPAPYNQGYGNQGVIGQVISQVLGGGRYGAYGQGNDRMAVDQCARAVEARVSNDNRRGVYGSWNRNYANQAYNNQNYRNYGVAQVVGITGVERRQNGVRVSGLIDTRMRHHPGQYGQYNQQGQYGQYNQQGQYNPYGQPYPSQAYGQPGYGNQGYDARHADLRFNCRIDNRGRVADVDIRRNRRG